MFHYLIDIFILKIIIRKLYLLFNDHDPQRPMSGFQIPVSV